jgi:sugar/nucleoside kinase (ribokinase family)
LTGRPPGAPLPPQLVVVGAASRDLAADDGRGWRLGGGVSYGALTAARLGVRTGAIVGVDAEAERADELDLLRAAGVDVRLVRLARGPVFVNLEGPGGRVQECVDRSDPIPVQAVPDSWRGAAGWLLAPVAAELDGAWSGVPSEAALVALGWQGLLRRLVPGRPVERLDPRPDPLLRRADLVGVSADDLDRRADLAGLRGLLRPDATLIVTNADGGGVVVRRPGAELEIRRYPAIAAGGVVDPTGAGDVFLAALAAARVEPRLVGGRIGQSFDLLLAAAAGSLAVEAPGLRGVPDRAAVRARMAEGRRASARIQQRKPSP